MIHRGIVERPRLRCRGELLLLDHEKLVLPGKLAVVGIFPMTYTSARNNAARMNFKNERRCVFVVAP